MPVINRVTQMQAILLGTLKKTCKQKRFISLNNILCNTAAAADSNISKTDKFLHYTDENGYYKTSPHSPLPPIDVTLDKYIWRDFKKWENEVATVCVVTGRQFTYAQLRDASAALAVRLQTKLKLNKGEVIGVCLPNLPEYPIAALGAIEAGLVVTTINPIYTAEEIARQLQISNAKFLIGTTLGLSVLQEACKLIEKDIPIACIRFTSEETLPAGAIDFYELINTNGVDFSQLKHYDVSVDDMVFLPFSSGTTGLPKGVVLSHRNITTNSEQVWQPFSDGGPVRDVVPAILPFFHIYGLTVVMLSKLGLGGKILTMPQFRPEYLMKSLDEYKSTILNLVPPIALFMINHPNVNVETTASLKFVMSGAAPIGINDMERFLEKFPHTKFLQGYGMTEASPVILLTNPDNKRYASTGFLPSSTEAKIVVLDGSDLKGLGPNTTGELCVRGPQVMSGYLNNDEANKETFYPGNWLRTGDVAYYDQDGYFYITDRMKELIKVKGFQVPPAELEALLRNHPKILEAAVFGIPNPVSGEAPRALIVPQPDVEIDEEEIYDYVAERVAHYKKLDGGIIFVKEIPKSTTGKILRKVLKEQFSS